ncbi:hypothetical protein Syun_018626 [Stephania yunnanensis]|uniref:Uncharacterized protein n=1 Tax=Stephania yunnanensis TaxID=152371 RepID=A0AAP0ISR0_9MAGN
MEFSTPILLQEITKSTRDLSFSFLLFLFLASNAAIKSPCNRVVTPQHSSCRYRYRRRLAILLVVPFSGIESSAFRWPSVHHVSVFGGPSLLELRRHRAALTLQPRRGRPLPSFVQPSDYSHRSCGLLLHG